MILRRIECSRSQTSILNKPCNFKFIVVLGIITSPSFLFSTSNVHAYQTYGYPERSAYGYPSTDSNQQSNRQACKVSCSHKSKNSSYDCSEIRSDRSCIKRSNKSTQLCLRYCNQHKKTDDSFKTYGYSHNVHRYQDDSRKYKVRSNISEDTDKSSAKVSDKAVVSEEPTASQIEVPPARLSDSNTNDVRQDTQVVSATTAPYATSVGYQPDPNRSSEETEVTELPKTGIQGTLINAFGLSGVIASGSAYYRSRREIQKFLT